MVYARRQTRPKPRRAQSMKWPAPVAGWVSNRALSDPASIDGPGAAVLDNFFPQSTGVSLRRGKALYATLEDLEADATSLFSYKNGTSERLYGANSSTIYDLTDVIFPEPSVVVNEDGLEIEADPITGDVFGWGSTLGLDVAGGFSGGDWSVIQFATSGGIYLIGVNGVDTGFIFDGDAFYPYVVGGVSVMTIENETVAFQKGEVVTGGTSGATATVARVVDDGVPGEARLYLYSITGTFQIGEALAGSVAGSADVLTLPVADIPGVTFTGFSSADMSFVWTYKNALWFVQRDTLNIWYLPVDSVGGTATVFPLGGVFANGGKLLFGQRWSLESGGQGGLSDQNIFVTDQGEVAIYQGFNPAEAATWSLVGVYRIGAPLGKRAYIRGGGDIAIATSVGLVPLSKAISLDVTALNVASVSYKIADAWTDAVNQRGKQNWQAMVWPEEKLAAIAPPDLIEASDPVLFVSNTETGAWARFTNWQALCMEVFDGTLYFGSPQGRIYRANVSGLDHGEAYSGAVVPLFNDMGAPGSAKIGKVARARVRAATRINDRVDLLTDYDIDLPAAPDAQILPASNTWDNGVWGQSVWGAVTPSAINQTWRSIGGVGYSIAPCYQVTSGAVAPIDVELIDMETLHDTAEVVT